MEKRQGGKTTESTSVKRSSIDAIFEKRCAKILNNLRYRHRALYRGKRLIRPEIPMPFTLLDLRRWVYAQFLPSGHGIEGVIECAYCPARIDVGTFTIDHKEPYRKSLDSRFENLCLCCEKCNEAKGDFSEVFYRTLLTMLDQAMLHGIVSPDEVIKLMSLVRMGWGYKRMAFHGRKNKPSLTGQMELDDATF